MTQIKTRDELDDLLERLEKATGPDRGLDWEIHKAVKTWMANAEYQDSGEPGDEEAIIWKAPDAKPDPSRWYHDSLPHYTRSLDAAMSLVPEGMAVELHRGPHDKFSEAEVVEPVRTDLPDGGRRTDWKLHASKCATMGVVRERPAALALCIAALRALKSRKDTP